MRLCLVTASVVSFITFIILMLRDVLPTAYAGAALVYAFQVRSFDLSLFAVRRGALARHLLWRRGCLCVCLSRLCIVPKRLSRS